MQHHVNLDKLTYELIHTCGQVSKPVSISMLLFDQLVKVLVEAAKGMTSICSKAIQEAESCMSNKEQD
jgi:hypothetical protein